MFRFIIFAHSGDRSLLTELRSSPFLTARAAILSIPGTRPQRQDGFSPGPWPEEALHTFKHKPLTYPRRDLVAAAKQTWGGGPEASLPLVPDTSRECTVPSGSRAVSAAGRGRRREGCSSSQAPGALTSGVDGSRHCRTSPLSKQCAAGTSYYLVSHQP